MERDREQGSSEQERPAASKQPIEEDEWAVAQSGATRFQHAWRKKRMSSDEEEDEEEDDEADEEDSGAGKEAGVIHTALKKSRVGVEQEAVVREGDEAEKAHIMGQGEEPRPHEDAKELLEEGAAEQEEAEVPKEEAGAVVEEPPAVEQELGPGGEGEGAGGQDEEEEKEEERPSLLQRAIEPLSEEEQRQLASAKKGKGPVSINNVIIARHELKALLSKSGEASDRMVEALLKALPYPGVVASNHPFFGESYLCCMAGPKGCTHQQLVQLKHQQLAKKDEIKIALPEHEGSIFNSSAPWLLLTAKPALKWMMAIINTEARHVSIVSMASGTSQYAAVIARWLEIRWAEEHPDGGSMIEAGWKVEEVEPVVSAKKGDVPLAMLLHVMSEVEGVSEIQVNFEIFKQRLFLWLTKTRKAGAGIEL